MKWQHSQLGILAERSTQNTFLKVRRSIREKCCLFMLNGVEALEEMHFHKDRITENRE